MVLGSFRNMEPGKVYRDTVTYGGERHHDVPIFIIRRATPEEYLQSLKDSGDGPTERDVRNSQHPSAFFYEVSVD